MKKILYSILLFISSMAYSQSLNDRILEIGNYIETDISQAITVLNEVKPEVLAASPDTIKFLYHYYSAAVEDLQGKTSDKKVEHLKEAKKIRETSLGIYDPTYLEIIWAIGNEYEERDSIETAIGYYQEGIVKGQSFNFENDPVASHWCGMTLISLGRIFEKKYSDNIIRDLYTSAFNFTKKEYSSDKSYSYYPLWKLSQFYKENGDYDKSIEICDRILSYIEKQEGGIYNSNYADELSNKAYVLLENEKYECSISCYNKCLDINNKIGNQYNPDIYYIYNYYIIALTNILDYDKTNSLIPLYRDFAINTGLQNKYMNSLYYICNEFIEGGKYNEAQYYSELLIKDVNFLDDDKEKNIIMTQQDNIKFLIENENRIKELLTIINHNDSINFEKCSLLFELGKRFNVKKKREEAILYFNETINGLKVLKKEKTDMYVYSLNNITRLYMDMNQYDKAHPYAIETMNYSKMIYGEESDEYTSSCNDLGVIYINIGNYEEGFKYAGIAVNKSIKKYGTNNIKYAMTIHNLGRLYQLTGNIDKAKSLLEESKRIQLSLNGSVAPKTEQYLKEIEGGNAK